MKKTLLGLALTIFSLSAQAAFIPTSSWHNTNDEFGGLKQNRFNEDIFLAVSNSNLYTNRNQYEMIEGFRWASQSDFVIPTYEERTSVPLKLHYANQGGWNGITFEGVDRRYFIFSDTILTSSTNNAISSSGIDDRYGSSNVNYINRYLYDFAGFVLFREDKSIGSTDNANSSGTGATEVPEPAMLGVFAAGLLGLLFARRKKSRA